MSNTNDILQFKKYLRMEIMDAYNIDKETANNAIQVSKIDVLLESDLELVEHYSIEMWAENVWKSYNKRENDKAILKI